MLKEFGSLGAALAADPVRQKRVVAESATNAALAWFRSTMMIALRREALSQPLLTDWRSLSDYLHADMAYARHESVRVLYLDVRNRLIREECLAEGTINEASVHIRPVIARALDLGAAAILLIHNHPSGDPQPSRSDIDLTKALAEAGRRLSIAVHDHIVVSRTGLVSLRALQLI